MKDIKLGNLEELVIMLVALLAEDAYTVSIVNEYYNQTGNKINVSAIHTVLYRLEEKGFLESHLGDPSGTRGGKRKRLFSVTAFGKKALSEQESMRAQLRNQISEKSLRWN